MRNALTFIKHILTIALVILGTTNLSYASHQHASPECYLKGHRIYVRVVSIILVRHGPVGGSLVQHQNWEEEQSRTQEIDR